MGLPVFREPSAAESRAAAKADPTATQRSSIRRQATIHLARHRHLHPTVGRSALPREQSVSSPRPDADASRLDENHDGIDFDDPMADVPELIEINGRLEPLEAIRRRGRRPRLRVDMNQGDSEWSNLLRRQAHLRRQLAATRGHRSRRFNSSEVLNRLQTDDESEPAGQVPSSQRRRRLVETGRLSDSAVPPPPVQFMPEPRDPDADLFGHGSLPPSNYISRIPTPPAATPSPTRPVSRYGPTNADLESLPPLRRMGRRSINPYYPSRLSPPDSTTIAPEANGLGDRQRSWSPESDRDQWETLLTTITPDPSLPSASSSFAATSSFTNAHDNRVSNPPSSFSAMRGAAALPTPPPPAPEVPYNCDPPMDSDSESEGGAHDSNDVYARSRSREQMDLPLSGVSEWTRELRREVDRFVNHYREFNDRFGRGQRSEEEARSALAEMRDLLSRMSRSGDLLVPDESGTQDESDQRDSPAE